jgi:hypothetical protein
MRVAIVASRGGGESDAMTVFFRFFGALTWPVSVVLQS